MRASQFEQQRRHVSWRGGYHGPYYAASRGEAAAGDPGSGRSGVTPASFQTSYRGGFGAFGHAVRGGS